MISVTLDDHISGITADTAQTRYMEEFIIAIKFFISVWRTRVL